MNLNSFFRTHVHTNFDLYKSIVTIILLIISPTHSNPICLPRFIHTDTHPPGEDRVIVETPLNLTDRDRKGYLRDARESFSGLSKLLLEIIKETEIITNFKTTMNSLFNCNFTMTLLYLKKDEMSHYTYGH